MTDPNCPHCDGTGIVVYLDGDVIRETDCDCVERDEPKDTDAWSGGFAENH